MGASSAHATARLPQSPVRSVDAFSLSFLGMYRKLLEIESQIKVHADRQGADFSLARAICLFESGANPDLTSSNGGSGYFQLTSATKRSVGAAGDIEAAVKYLVQLQKRFGREDYAVAAFHVGPSGVNRRRPMNIDTLHIVAAVGAYRNVLRVHESAVRRHAQDLSLATVEEGDTWASLAERLKVPIVHLRMYNPQLASRLLVRGNLVAYPVNAPPPRRLFEQTKDGLEYRSRIGDTYDTIAAALELDPDALRRANQLWYLQEIPPGMVLKIPLTQSGAYAEHGVETGETLGHVAARLGVDAWRIIRDNGLVVDERLPDEGGVIRIRRTAPPLQPAHSASTAPASEAPAPRVGSTTDIVHRVAAGDTLGSIARRYGTTVQAIQMANDMGRRTTIRIGELLKIPTR